MPIPAKTLKALQTNQFQQTCLNLHDCNLSIADIRKLLPLLDKNPHIQELTITKNPQLDDACAKLLAKNTTLRVLRLKGANPNITLDGLSAFLKNTTLIELPITGGSGKKLDEIRSHIRDNARNKKEETVSDGTEQSDEIVLIEDRENEEDNELIFTEDREEEDDGELFSVIASDIDAYLKAPVTRKKKTGEDNFLQLISYLFLDLEYGDVKPKHIVLYLAIVLNHYMHNSSYCPEPGFGKVQAREAEHALYYYRSQLSHPHRKLYDQLSKEADDTRKTGVLPRNEVFTKLLAHSAIIDNDYAEQLWKIKSNGFPKKGQKLPSFFGAYFALSGARANNLAVYESGLSAFRDRFDENDEFITQLRKKLKLTSRGNKIKSVSKKIEKLDKEVVDARIKGIVVHFKILNAKAEKVSVGKEEQPAYADVYKQRQQMADSVCAINSELQQLKLVHPLGSSCLCIDIYPEFTDEKLKRTMNYESGLTNVIISFFGGLLNYHAAKRGLSIRTQRRQSFGFLRATLSDIGSMRMRLSLGLEPEIYREVIAESLRDLDKLLVKFNFIDRKNPIVEKAFQPCENAKGKEKTEKTGNYLTTSMRATEHRWQAFLAAEYYLFEAEKGEDAADKNKENAFSKFLSEFIVEHKGDKHFSQKDIQNVQQQKNILQEKPSKKTIESNVLFQILKNLVTYATNMVMTQQEYQGEFSHCYWHSLLKLYKNCNKAISILENQDQYPESHLYAKSALLIENMLEYLISLDSLRKMASPCASAADSESVKALVSYEQQCLMQEFGLSSDAINLFFADSGQQAINLGFTTLHWQLSLSKKLDPGEEVVSKKSNRPIKPQPRSDGTVPYDTEKPHIFLFENSYFEVGHFLEEAMKYRTREKEKAKIVFVDITELASFKLEEFPNMTGVLIDITHNPNYHSPQLQDLIKKLHERNIWVTLVMSSLKHEQLGLDKYQTGKVIHLPPQGETLFKNVEDELKGVSDAAMHPMIASYLNMVNSVCERHDAIKKPDPVLPKAEASISDSKKRVNTVPSSQNNGAFFKTAPKAKRKEVAIVPVPIPTQAGIKKRGH